MPIGDENDAREAARLLQVLPQGDPRRQELVQRMRAWDTAVHSNVPVGQRSNLPPGQPQGAMVQSPSGPLDRVLTGAGRTLDYLGRGIKQIATNLSRPAPAYMTADPREAQQLAGDRGLELQGKLYATDAEKQEQIVNMQKQEASARQLYSLIDDDEGIFGTTIGLEDIGELIPDTIAFLGTGSGSSFTQLGLRAGLVGMAGATTEEESRLQNTLLSGIFGVTFPGALRSADFMARNSLFFTRFAAGLLGSVAGWRGMGRSTTLLAKIGGQARQLQVNAGDAARLRELMTQAANRLRPLVEGLNSREVQRLQANAMGDLLTSNIRSGVKTSRERITDSFRRNLDYTVGSVDEATGKVRAGLDVSGFLRDIEGLADGTLRGKTSQGLGPIWGQRFVDFREFGNIIAPEIDTILQRGVLPDKGIAGMRNAIIDYMGSGSFRAIQQLKSPTERRLRHLDWLQRITSSMGAQAQAAEDNE